MVAEEQKQTLSVVSVNVGAGSSSIWPSKETTRFPWSARMDRLLEVDWLKEKPAGVVFLQEMVDPIAYRRFKVSLHYHVALTKGDSEDGQKLAANIDDLVMILPWFFALLLFFINWVAGAVVLILVYTTSSAIRKVWNDSATRAWIKHEGHGLMILVNKNTIKSDVQVTTREYRCNPSILCRRSYMTMQTEWHGHKIVLANTHIKGSNDTAPPQLIELINAVDDKAAGEHAAIVTVATDQPISDLRIFAEYGYTDVSRQAWGDYTQQSNYMFARNFERIVANVGHPDWPTVTKNHALHATFTK